jgi:hypothetical protein
MASKWKNVPMIKSDWMGYLFSRIVDNRSESSLATAFRRQRFELFNSLLARFPVPVKVLDVGGNQRFWELMGLAGNNDIQITIVNLFPQATEYSNLHAKVGDACDLNEFENNSYEIVFSNSVIEHLGSYENQERMANEVMRLGKKYYVQTPNRFFPIEPHFLVPFFQFFPLDIQIAMVRRFNLGWYKRIPEIEKARVHILSHRLLNQAELSELFPDGSIYREKIFGLTKSFVVFRTDEPKNGLE